VENAGETSNFAARTYSDLLLVLALGHDCRSEATPKIVGQFVKLRVAVNLDGLLCCIANNEAVMAPLKMLFQLAPCTSINRFVQVVG
jgi:hypothetical protein